jgi:hypothetical protein
MAIKHFWEGRGRLVTAGRPIPAASHFSSNFRLFFTNTKSDANSGF